MRFFGDILSTGHLQDTMTPHSRSLLDPRLVHGNFGHFPSNDVVQNPCVDVKVYKCHEFPVTKCFMYM